MANAGIQNMFFLSIIRAEPKSENRYNFRTWLFCLSFNIMTFLLFFFTTATAQIQPLPSTTPRSREVIDVTRVNESWARDWDVTHTAAKFPDGGRAGFYRRPPRMGDAVPHTGRLGILYLYPESDYRPAKISRRHVQITQGTSRLVISVCANRVPLGEWILKLFLNNEQFGEEVTIFGDEKWQDIAFNLSSFIGHPVDLEIEAHASLRRAAHVYIDYIGLENPARQPVSKLTGGWNDSRSHLRTMPEQPVPQSLEDPDQDPLYFDIYYWNFIELLREREERRRYDYDYYYYHDRNRHYHKKR